jgi:hypothetical protein
VSTQYIFILGSNQGVTKVQGTVILYIELAEQVPTIFSHFMINLSAMYSFLVFVYVKYHPMGIVLAEEQFLFHCIGPKEHKMYRCTTRYDMDTINGNVESKNQLLEFLKEFIQLDYIHMILISNDLIMKEIVWTLEEV